MPGIDYSAASAGGGAAEGGDGRPAPSADDRPDDRSDQRSEHRAEQRTGRRTARDADRSPTAQGRIAELHGEVPCTVAILVGDEDFTAMRRHSTFRFEDYEDYLRRTDELLRALYSRGLHVRVAAFDPEAFAGYCAAHGLDPSAPVTRARFAAEAAALGGTARYEGEPLHEVIEAIIHGAEHRAAQLHAEGVLAHREEGERARCDMSRVITALVGLAGPGRHHLVGSATVRGVPLLATLLVHTEVSADGSAHAVGMDEEAATRFCSVLAAAVVTGGAGGVVLRTRMPGDRYDTVRGWALLDGRLRPLREAEVFSAYCTDHRTGEPIPPEPGVDYRAGFALPDASLPEGRRKPGGPAPRPPVTGHRTSPRSGTGRPTPDQGPGSHSTGGSTSKPPGGPEPISRPHEPPGSREGSG